MSDTDKLRAIELREERHENVKEDILDIENAVDDPQYAHDRILEMRFFISETVLKAYYAINDVRQDTGLQQRVRQETLQYVISWMYEEGNNGFSLQDDIFT